MSEGIGHERLEDMLADLGVCGVLGHRVWQRTTSLEEWQVRLTFRDGRVLTGVGPTLVDAMLRGMSGQL